MREEAGSGVRERERKMREWAREREKEKKGGKEEKKEEEKRQQIESTYVTIWCIKSVELPSGVFEKLQQENWKEIANRTILMSVELSELSLIVSQMTTETSRSGKCFQKRTHFVTSWAVPALIHLFLFWQMAS